MKILVVGDSMIDVSLTCEVTRLSPEAPIPIYDILRRDKAAGGAANVAANIHAMGGDVTLLTAVASSAALPKGPLSTIVPAENTTTKTRVFVDGVMRTRIDDDYILTEEESETFCARFVDMFRPYEVIVFSDYGKGTLRHVSDMLAHCDNRTTIVDPKGTNWQKYAGTTVIKGNYTEVNAVTDDMGRLARELNVDYLIQTLGAQGSNLHYSAGGDNLLVKPLRTTCVDATGAGDSYLAAMAVALSERVPMHEAAEWGSVAGAIAVSRLGTHVVTRAELQRCLMKY